MSKFNHIPLEKFNTILDINRVFAADPNPKKVALAVGAYRDENGKPWILPSVKAAEAIISADLTKCNKEYPSQPGFPLYVKAVQSFLLGDDHPALAEKRVATCQSLSGTGSLHSGFSFLFDHYRNHKVYVPSVTWPNHYDVIRKVYRDIPYFEYTYLFKNGSLKIDFENTLKDMEAAEDGSIFLLHACAHNPSGIDFSKDNWKAIAELFKRKGHIAFFDVAY